MELKDCFFFFFFFFFFFTTATVAGAVSAVFIFRAGKSKRYYPVGCTILHLLVNIRTLHDYVTELSRKHGTFRVFDLFLSEVLTTDPSIVEFILKTNFPNYGKGWYHYKLLTDLLGDGIFAVDAEKWRQQRKLSSYEFSTKNLRDFSSSVFKTNAVKLAKLLSEKAASNQSVDIQELFMNTALDSVFKILLGVELDAMYGTNEEGTRFSNAFDRASEITLFRYFDVFWRIKRFLNIGSEAELRKNIKLVDDFVYRLITSKIEQVRNPSPDDLHVKKEDLVSRFLEQKETDAKYLRDIILSFVIAGKDTTAIALSWFLYMLCKHPDVQERIAEEVIQATQVRENDETIADELAASVNEETLDKMHYLHAALTETLRLYPSVPLEAKQCLSDDTMPDGFSVKKGDVVSFLPYAMGRMKHLWGNDAEEFKPERWLNEHGIFQHESPFKFTAFQAGPRICLGKEFAYRQMKIFSMILLGTYRFKVADETKTPKYRVMLTLNIEEGLHLQIFPRFIGPTTPVAS